MAVFAPTNDSSHNSFPTSRREVVLFFLPKEKKYRNPADCLRDFYAIALPVVLNNLNLNKIGGAVHIERHARGDYYDITGRHHIYALCTVNGVTE